MVDEKFNPFLPKGIKRANGTDLIGKTDVAMFLFPSQKNLKLQLRLKRQQAKILYVFHEPLAPLRTYRKAGFSYKYLAKLWIINKISALTVKWSDAVLLPSRKAVEYYEANPVYKNGNYHYLPLMFDDEARDRNILGERKYFSYIGTAAPDHSFAEYVKFVEHAVLEGFLPGIEFLIATKSDVALPETLKNTPRVKVQQGRPLTDEEINRHFMESFCIWNAYARTTQSGVLAKSMMFGTPAIVLRKNLNEFVEDGQEVVAIGDNNDIQEIRKAIAKVKENFQQFSLNCRNRFLRDFYYRQHNFQIAEILK